ncbi:MAG: S41 family peptidase [bacterium]|nr:S41 family peptidase [bacterium]
MSKPWRNLAIVLFAGSLVFGGTAGEKLLALSDESEAQIQLYTEMLHLAHESYGAEVPYKNLVYASIQGMLRGLDPHTSFLTPEAYDNMRERQQGSFYGLGILVSKRSGELTVISPIEGTPAWRLGLRAGDVISTIEGEPTNTMTLDEAVRKLKGPKDTQVNVHITRRGLKEPLKLAITRAEIPQNTVRYAYMMTPETGYIRLTDFSRSTTREVKEALDKLEGEGMKQLILDLRSNGGGLLDQTVAVSRFFVPERSSIVETRGRLRDSHQSFLSDESDEMLDIPLVVLVNNGTASAAEILAGAIQDHDVGLVVGEPTWGKGLVQTVYNLSYGTGIALTTAKYYTPSGRLIQRDYSSYYDYYYNHFGDDDEEDTPEVALDSLEYQTDLGRKVYGGGGIAPDELVEMPDGPIGLQPLFAENAFFEFAVDYHAREKIAEESWQPPEGFVDEFRQWTVDEEILTGEEIDEILADEQARDFTRRQIHSDIFTAAFGTEAAHQVVARGDVQIQAALDLFGPAGELLAMRQELKDGPLDIPVPTIGGRTLQGQRGSEEGELPE